MTIRIRGDWQGLIVQLNSAISTDLIHVLTELCENPANAFPGHSLKMQIHHSREN